MEKAKEAGFALHKYFVPLSILLIVGIVCSNQAYLYCSVPFLQFMKEWNIALVFMFSCFVGLQTCDRVKSFVIIWIVIAGSVAVSGKMIFSHVGFCIQLLSQFGETSRIVLQEWLLSGRELRLDPLTYQLFVGPPTMVALAVLNFFTWDANIPMAAKHCWPYLLANACIACILNVTITTLIKHAGGVSFVLSGVVKDIMIVCSAAYIAKENLNSQELAGFFTATAGILVWSLCKVVPEHFIVVLLYRCFYSKEENLLSAVLCGKEDLSAKKPLVDNTTAKSTQNA